APPPVAVPATAGREVAVLAGGGARLRFVSHPADGGGAVVRRVTEVRVADGWVPVSDAAESILVLRDATNTVEAGQINPRWHNPANELVIRSGGRDYRTAADSANPWRAAPSVSLVARTAVTRPDGSVSLALDGPGGETATLTWSLAPGGGDFAAAVSYTPLRDGFASVGLAPFAPRDAGAVAFNLLPPLYQFQRLPVRPMSVPSSVTPQPLALIELAPDAGRPAVTLGVAADPADLPFDWPDATNARYGFTLQSDDGRLQPAAFRPLLGLGDSEWPAGETRVLRWRVLARPGDWRETLAYASESIFGVTDYRHSLGGSLTDAALNMIDLMRDPERGGWDPELRGFWNIEGRGVATQAAPLAVLSAAVLTEDEALYASHALPSVEWTLTRPIAHFAREVPDTHPPYVNEKSIRITTPSRFFGAAHWQGVDALLGAQANPWAGDLVKRAAAAGPRQKWVPAFADTLALYRLDPSPELLERASVQAAAWVAREIDGRKTGDLGYTPFYNHDFIPVWWDLLALHELTGEARWLEAARTGGMLTVAGLRSHPRPDAPEKTIHPGGDFTGNNTLWWRGEERFRLGLPRTPGDVVEKTVPAWQVSPVGLGFEQPSTFFAGGGRGNAEGFQTIMMSSWTPALLRLHAATGQAVYRDYARGGIVGRFANYPGYYLRGFTDLVHDADYPLKGPDVTSFYYHHIPVHLAFTLDWLFAEASLRSAGAITFPWVQQAGYVWFNNRIYGQSGGEIFGHKNARPVLPKGITVADPGLNWIAARTPDRLWVVLMNDAAEARPARVRLDAAALGVDTTRPVLVHLPGEVAPRPFTPSLTVPPRGLVALSYASADAPRAALPPVAAEPLRAGLGVPWGDVLAWRIRSPFGRDSIYVCLDGRPDEGARVELLLEEDDPAAGPRVANRFPFEFTVHPLPPEQSARFRLRLTAPDGTATLSPRFELPGISRPQ
ncbi:MAG: hypothetical protein ABII82_07035, partial [Verrucomicrobiota bacterium]